MSKHDVSRFIDGAGKVRQWPTKHSDKALVVAYLATKFEAARSYTEPEINEILKNWHTFGDWPLLRRELYEQGYLDRAKDGSNYHRTTKL